MTIPQTPSILTQAGPGIQIAVQNLSTEASDAEVKTVLHALQVQVNRDFFPIWGIRATFNFFAKTAILPANQWWFAFLDTADQAGALGYHDLTTTGLPLGKIFVKTTILDKMRWSVTASHEALEILVDPYCDLAIFDQLSTNAGAIAGALYGYEVCDPVEDDSFGYNIGGVRVSNFVTPYWFERGLTGVKYDFLGELTVPLSLLPNGYASTFSVPNTQGWTQLLGKTRTSRANMISTKRLEDRADPSPWILSTVAIG